MKHLTEDELKIWKKKRARTLVGYLIIGVVGGVDYSIVFATLYLYLTTLIETSHPELYYGLTIAVYSASSTLCGLISGRLVDKYRRVKIYIYLVLILQIIGNLMYVLHFSPLFPLFGRLIAGAGDSFSSVCSGEIIRLYNEKESTSALWMLASAYSIGFAFGPVVGIIFKGIEFKIASISFDYTNFAGLFIAGLTLICLFVSLLIVSDCSLEFDMKAYLSTGAVVTEDFLESSIPSITEKSPLLNGSNNNNHVTTNNNKNTTNILKELLKNLNLVFMFTSSFFFMYCMFSFDVTLPLIVLELLKWDSTSLMIVLVCYGCGYFVCLIIGSKLCTTNHAVYWTCISCILCQLGALSIIITLKLVERNAVRDLILFVIFLIMYTFVWFIEEVLLRSLVAKMVPSHVQSFTESIRNGCSRLSTVVAALTAPLAFAVIQYWSMGLLAVTVLFLLLFIMKRKSLIDVVEMEI